MTKQLEKDINKRAHHKSNWSWFITIASFLLLIWFLVLLLLPQDTQAPNNSSQGNLFQFIVDDLALYNDAASLTKLYLG